MNSVKISPIIIFFILLNLVSTLAQENYNTKMVTDSIAINFDNNYNISSVSIIPFSERIILRDSLLVRYQDYQIKYSTATFTLSDSLPYSIFDTLYLTYETIKLSLNKEYKRRSLVIKYDEATGDTVRITEIKGGGLTPDAIFGPGIQKSGTLIRGFTVGTTKDFTLNSGLRLQLSGKLSDEIEIVAALTDENTPIQPEGNTERLEELDKVFVQIKHPNAVGTFGDYQLTKRVGEFGVINRKLQGLSGEFNYEGHLLNLAVASSRGKFNTNSFRGIDGVQGPYALSGINGEKNIIVLAGTEQVFVDGIQMKRGENNDYTIEYSNATITFTPQRLITASSRINVDFEYTARKYSRNFFSGGGSSGFFNNKLKFQYQYLQEGDDETSPIDFTLSEEDKNIIAAAGNDRLKAVKSGVSLVLPDSLGNIKGVYAAVDTLIDNETFTYYVYKPGDSTAIYSVSFTYIADGEGDYIKEAIGNYKFVGKNNGSYLPIIFLPVPEKNKLGNLVVNYSPFDNTTLSVEYAGSYWDRNKLSTVDDDKNYGYATNILLNINPTQVVIGSMDLGKMGLTYKDRFIQGRFFTSERINQVEFNRDYNVTQSEVREDESLREIRLTLIPIDQINFSSSAGFLRKGENFKSNRFNNILHISDNNNYNLNYKLDYVESENVNTNTQWLRQEGNGYYTLWKLKPGIEFLAENKENKWQNNDSLIAGSLKYQEINPYLELVNITGFSFLTKYSLRDDYLPVNGTMQKEARATAQFYELAYSGIKEVNSTFNLTLRDREFSEVFKQMGSLDNQTILIRSSSRFRFWEQILNGNLFYEVSTKRTARLENIFVPVELGTGNYIYVGDLNNNGVADEDEFSPTIYDGDFILITRPTDQLFPVIELKTSTRWKIKYAQIFDRNTFLGSILKPVSSETVWRIEEITREEDFSKIYFLNLGYFQNEGNTIRGSNYFQQDLFLFENSSELSFRFRFTQNIRMSEYNAGIEQGYNRERSMRIRFRMVKEISNQTDITNITDNITSNANLTRNLLKTENTVTSDFSYRPGRTVEVGFVIKFGRSEDIFPDNPTVIDLNSQKIRFNLSITGGGRLRIELERSELLANTNKNYIPFELTSGNQLGKNYYGRLNFDYRVASFLQVTVNYNGRLQGGRRVIHTARAEARAYF